MPLAIEDGIWRIASDRPGRTVCLSFGVHGNERSPIDAGLELVRRVERGDVEVIAGTLLLVHANPKASQENERWSAGGVDLNRCFHANVLARAPTLHEEHRARQIVAALEASAAEILVDFHCTIEPGRRFLMHHPPAGEPKHREVSRLLEAETVLADPTLRFGGVSFDEWMSTRGRVGICYETGWMGDPANTPDGVLREMRNVLAGLGSTAGDAITYDEKERIELYDAIVCTGDGFHWADGVGENLQALRRGTLLGRYADGRGVTLEDDATLIFPKKKSHLIQRGKPLVLLARRVE